MAKKQSTWEATNQPQLLRPLWRKAGHSSMSHPCFCRLVDHSQYYTNLIVTIIIRCVGLGFVEEVFQCALCWKKMSL